MILFKPEHVAPILAGKKTETRRLWKRCRVKVGALHWAQTRMFDNSSRFARLRIGSVRGDTLGTLTDEAAHAEGYPNIEEYLFAFARIYKMHAADLPMDLPLWVVNFQVESTPQPPPTKLRNLD